MGRPMRPSHGEGPSLSGWGGQGGSYHRGPPRGYDSYTDSNYSVSIVDSQLFYPSSYSALLSVQQPNTPRFCPFYSQPGTITTIITSQANH